MSSLLFTLFHFIHPQPRSEHIQNTSSRFSPIPIQFIYVLCRCRYIVAIAILLIDVVASSLAYTYSPIIIHKLTNSTNKYVSLKTRTNVCL